jgi:signal transduction histidine kinase
MDYAGLSLHEALNTEQFAQLMQCLTTYNLGLTLLDHRGEVVLPPPPTAPACCQAAATDSSLTNGCQQHRQSLCATVLQEGQARTIQCPGHGTLVAVPICPFSTSLGVLMACQTAVPQAPPWPRPDTQPDGSELIALLHMLLQQSITVTVQQLEIDNLATELLDRYEQLTFLFDLGRHVNPANEPSRIFKLVTEKVAQFYGEAYLIAIFHKEMVRQFAVAPDIPAATVSSLATQAQSLCQRLAQHVQSSNRTLVHNDLSSLGWEEDSVVFTASLATPILSNNQYYGTFNVFRTAGARPFFNSDIALIELVSKQIGIFLENHQLYQRLEAFHHSQRMEALGKLAGSIAHDFNNILSAILGYGELVKMDLPPESLPGRNLQNMLQAAVRAKDLVEQILAFSRQQKPKRQPVQLAQIIQEVLTLLGGSTPSSIELRHPSPTIPGSVLGDATQLHQVVMNLCTNAVHAMQEHGGVIEIGLTETALEADFAARQGIPPGTYVCLSVRDTGCGMPPEVVERIFEPFFTTKAAGKGTGMGLSVVHGIVQSHGGTITVTSVQGQGTTFQVFVPSIASSPDSTHPPDTPTPEGKKRILLVDDDANVLKVEQQILARLGYEAVATTSSLEALEIFRQAADTFDVVITDKIMPRLPGDVLAQELLHLRPDIPIIMVTGFGKGFGPEQAKALGIREYLMKPITARDLQAAIQRVMA